MRNTPLCCEGVKLKLLLIKPYLFPLVFSVKKTCGQQILRLLISYMKRTQFLKLAPPGIYFLRQADPSSGFSLQICPNARKMFSSVKIVLRTHTKLRKRFKTVK